MFPHDWWGGRVTPGHAGPACSFKLSRCLVGQQIERDREIEIERRGISVVLLSIVDVD